MSVPPHRRLPERPSLEQLRKQAKEHLGTLRATDPSVSLAAAQHALAREYGFDSWPKLRTSSSPSIQLATSLQNRIDCRNWPSGQMPHLRTWKKSARGCMATWRSRLR